MHTKTETNGWGSGSSCFGDVENRSLLEIKGHLVVPDDEGSARLDLDTRRGFGDGDIKWGGNEDATGGGVRIMTHVEWVLPQNTLEGGTYSLPGFSMEEIYVES